jgi:hypothetical protein
MDRFTGDFLKPGLGIIGFAVQRTVVNIGEIGMGHGVTTDFEILINELSQLCCGEIARPSKPSGGDVEGGVEARLPQNRCGGEQVSFRAVVEADGNAFSGGEFQRSTNACTLVAAFFQVLYLLAKFCLGNRVAHIAGLGVAEGTPWNLQFVVHQENDGWLRRHLVLSKTRRRREQAEDYPDSVRLQFNLLLALAQLQVVECEVRRFVPRDSVADPG